MELVFLYSCPVPTLITRATAVIAVREELLDRSLPLRHQRFSRGALDVAILMAAQQESRMDIADVGDTAAVGVWDTV